MLCGALTWLNKIEGACKRLEQMYPTGAPAQSGYSGLRLIEYLGEWKRGKPRLAF